MKMQALILIATLAISSNGLSSEKVHVKNQLIGLWHSIPALPADWADTYSFYEDGTYLYRTSNMDCTRRLISIKGKWEYKNGTLTLTQKEKTHLIDGKIILSHSSCADGKELEGATEKVSKITPNGVLSYKLKEIEQDPKFKSILSNKITINNQPYWKFSNDPNFRN